MINNYFNPNAYKPDMGGMMMPNAFDMQQDRQTYQQMAGLQRLMTELELRKMQEDEKEGFASRQARRGFETSDYGQRDAVARARTQPGYIAGQMAGEQGGFQQQAAEGRFATETLPGRTNVANMDNGLRMMAGKLGELRQLAAASPMFAQAGYGQWRQSLPEQVRDQFPLTYSPDWVEGRMKVLADTINQRQEMEKTRMTTQSAEKIGKGHNDAARYAADQRLEAAWARTPPGTRDKVETIINKVLGKIMDGQPLTEGEKNAYMAAQQIMMNIRAAGGLPMDQNAVNWNIMNPRTPPPPRPVPAPVAPPAQPGPVPQPSPTPQLAPGAGVTPPPAFRWNPQTRRMEPIGPR